MPGCAVSDQVIRVLWKPRCHWPGPWQTSPKLTVRDSFPCSAGQCLGRDGGFCCEANKSPGLWRSRVRFRGLHVNVHDEYLRARPQPRLLRALLGPWHCRLGFGCWLSCFPAIIAGGGLLTQVAAAGPGFSLNLGGGGQGTLALLTCVQHVYRLHLMP